MLTAGSVYYGHMAWIIIPHGNWEPELIQAMDNWRTVGCSSELYNIQIFRCWLVYGFSLGNEILQMPAKSCHRRQLYDCRTARGEGLLWSFHVKLLIDEA